MRMRTEATSQPAGHSLAAKLVRALSQTPCHLCQSSYATVLRLLHEVIGRKSEGINVAGLRGLQLAATRKEACTLEQMGMAGLHSSFYHMRRCPPGNDIAGVALEHVACFFPRRLAVGQPSCQFCEQLLRHPAITAETRGSLAHGAPAPGKARSAGTQGNVCRSTW